MSLIYNAFKKTPSQRLNKWKWIGLILLIISLITITVVSFHPRRGTLQKDHTHLVLNGFVSGSIVDKNTI